MGVKMILWVLGIRDLAPQGKKLLTKYALLFALASMMINASTTYYILYVLSFVTIQQLGVLLALSMVVQLLLDYPTGALSDWMGQRWMLFFAYMTFALSFILLSESRTFGGFVLVFLLKGVAQSQHSEALSSWLHLNYKSIADEVDPNREHYKGFITRYKVIGNSLTALSYVVAGYVAFIFDRPMLFRFQALAFVLLSWIYLFSVRNLTRTEGTKGDARRTYFSHLKGGIRIVIISGKVRYLMFSATIWMIALSGWASFFLHPIYYVYTGSDVGAGVMRSLVWWLEAIMIFSLASVIVRKFNEKWIYKIRLLQSLAFFGGFAILSWLFPLASDSVSFNFIAIVLALGLMMFNSFCTRVYNTLFSVIYLDLIPDEYRNAAYSLIPTVTLIGSIPLLFAFGGIIEMIGVPISILLLSLLGMISAIFARKAILSEISIEKEKKIQDAIDSNSKYSSRGEMSIR